MAHKKDLRSAHEIRVVGIVEVGDGVNVGCHELARFARLFEKGAGEINVAQRQQVAVGRCPHEALVRKGGFLRVLQVDVDLLPAFAVIEDD